MAKAGTRMARLMCTSVLTSVAFAAATPVLAQGDAAASGDTVTVTGSRVARSTFTSESPVTVVDGDALSLSGDLNLGESLRQQLAIGNGGFNSSSVLSGGGAQSIDLRNLGPERVLNLINGRRVASFADALQNEAADLSFVPQAMIDRIEILRDGASPTYGTDAVTGVVNVILKDDFEGLEFSGMAGISDQGDREQYQLQAVMGANMDRGNIVFSAEYNYAAKVFQRDRDWAIPSISFLGAGFIVNGSGAHPGGNVNFVNGGTSIDWCTRPRAFGGDEITNVAGTPLCPAQAPSDPNDLIGRYDYALQQTILNGSEVINLAAFGNYDISDNIRFFMEMQYSNRKGESVLDGNPIFGGSGSPAFPTGWRVPNTNPYNPLGVGGGGAFHLVTIRPTSTVGPRQQFVDATSLRGVAGFKGTVFEDFAWELSYLYTEVQAEIVTDSTFNLARAIRISDPVACGADPICSAALNPLGLGALDVYRPGNWSQSEINYFRQVSNATTKFQLEQVSGVIAGDLFEGFGAGPIGVALGFDYREESVENRPDAVTEAGESVANQTFSTFGGFDTREIFGEVNIPILKDMPYAQSLSLNGQLRYFDYSNFGDGWVWKTGLNYVPFEDLVIRATYGTSFRAPTLVDTFSGGTVSFDFIDDPCDATNPELVNPVRAANCAAATPPGFTQTAAQLLVLAGGDLADGTFDLDPEEGRTITAGFSYAPSQLEGFRITADYWNIEVTNFIDSVDVEGEILDVCYDSVGLSAPECALFSRNPITFQLTGLSRTPINRTDPLKTSGFDWFLEYQFDLGPGQLRFDHQGTYVLTYNIFPGVGNIGGSSGSALIPEYRLTGGAQYDFSDMFFRVQARFIPGMTVIDRVQPNFLGYTGTDAHTEIDIRAGWDPMERTSIVVGVNNLTNKEPPYVFNTGNNTAPGVYGTAVVGRYFFIRATQSF